ncbi:MAG: hypothetical protein ACTHNP_07960 [Solirubrobacterales bacterium]
MLRFQPATISVDLRQGEWPKYSLDEPSTVFSPRPPLRKLVVVVDYDLLETLSCSRSSEDSLLSGLLSHPYIEVFRISDDGPPETAERGSTEQGVEYVPGWIVMGESSAEGGITPLVQASKDGTRIVRRALIGNAPEVAEDDPTSTAYQERGEDGAAAQRASDIRMLEAAREVGADLFITIRPYLHDLTWGFAREVAVGTPRQALPLVSLYLRRQGVFLSCRSPNGSATDSFNRGLFYWVGTRDLLPAGWRWFSACVEQDREQSGLVYLGQSLFQRVQRALQDRDAALWALNQPQNNDTADDALGSLDNVLLGLMAAVDITARVAHRALKLEGKEYSAGWQKERWLKKVRAAAPGLATVVAPGSSGAQVLEILRLLRNSIHGAALQPLAVSSNPNGRDATYVSLPPADADNLLVAMDAVGGRGAFGLRRLLPDRVHADPGKLLDAIFSRTMRLLDQLMRETPVERIAGASLSETMDGPPNDGIFDEQSRESVRMQLGLEQAESGKSRSVGESE